MGKCFRYIFICFFSVLGITFIASGVFGFFFSQSISLSIMFLIFGSLFIIIAINIKNYKKILSEKTVETIIESNNISTNDLIAPIQFIPTQIIKTIGNNLYIDENNKLWSLNPKKKPIYKFSDIRKFELVEFYDESSSGGLGRAVTGGLLFGVLGAIVGSSTGTKNIQKVITKMQIKINLNSISDPIVYFNLLSFVRTKSNSMTYKRAIKDLDKLLAIFDLMMKNS